MTFDDSNWIAAAREFSRAVASYAANPSDARLDAVADARAKEAEAWHAMHAPQTSRAPAGHITLRDAAELAFRITGKRYRSVAFKQACNRGEFTSQCKPDGYHWMISQAEFLDWFKSRMSSRRYRVNRSAEQTPHPDQA